MACATFIYLLVAIRFLASFGRSSNERERIEREREREREQALKFESKQFREHSPLHWVSSSPSTAHIASAWRVVSKRNDIRSRFYRRSGLSALEPAELLSLLLLAGR